jgi:hypothetical protein
VGVVRLGLAEDLAVVGGKALGEGVDGWGKGLKHRWRLPALVESLKDSTGVYLRHVPMLS